MRCKTKQEEDSRSVDLRVSSHHGPASAGTGIRRNPGEINDRRVRCCGRTEFGLPPFNEGRFGNGAPFAISGQFP